MKTIKFSNNWNNKLDNEYFTTIRLFTKEKFDYYYDIFDKKEEIAVLLKGKEKCLVKIVDIDVKLLGDIPDYIEIIDAGMDVFSFYKLMESMYKNKQEWYGKYTRMIILCFKKTQEI